MLLRRILEKKHFQKYNPATTRKSSFSVSTLTSLATRLFSYPDTLHFTDPFLLISSMRGSRFLFLPLLLSSLRTWHFATFFSYRGHFFALGNVLYYIFAYFSPLFLSFPTPAIFCLVIPFYVEHLLFVSLFERYRGVRTTREMGKSRVENYRSCR